MRTNQLIHSAAIVLLGVLGVGVLAGVELVTAPPASATEQNPRLGSIGDRVWRDEDRDGIQDPDESSAADVTVVLYGADGAEIERTETDRSGEYSFRNLPLGSYTVGFERLRPNVVLTVRDAGGDDAVDSDADPATGRTGVITLTAARPDVTDVDAGLATRLGSIGDRVWDDRDRDGVQDPDEPGLPGVTVVLFLEDGTEVERTATDAAGRYSFSELTLDLYTVGFTGLPEGAVLTTANAGDDDGADSDADPATGRTGGVPLTTATPDVTDVDAGVVMARSAGSIGSRVWRDRDRDGVRDADEPGVAGVTVVLLREDGAEAARTTTDESGAYSFAQVPFGRYTVVFQGLARGDGFAPRDAGDDAADSDPDPLTGRTGVIAVTAAAPDVTGTDAGIVALPPSALPPSALPPAAPPAGPPATAPGSAGVAGAVAPSAAGRLPDTGPGTVSIVLLTALGGVLTTVGLLALRRRAPLPAAGRDETR